MKACYKNKPVILPQITSEHNLQKLVECLQHSQKGDINYT